MHFATRIFVLFLFGLAGLGGRAYAQSGTAFTYQGELLEGAQAASGSFSMRFGLWDAQAGGSQIGTAITVPAVLVDDGRFAVDLDFGAEAFDNSARWLEIAVEGITLMPRHAVTRSPYSVQTRGIFVDAVERVGIGTTEPQHKVHVENVAPELRMSATGSNPSDYPKVQLQAGLFPSQFAPLGAVEFFDETGALRGGIYGNKSGGSASQLNFSAVPGELATLNVASSRVRVKDTLQLVRGSDLAMNAEIHSDGSDSFLQALGGRLAIGHDSPLAPLDVAGNGYFRDRLGIGVSSPFAPLDVNGNAFFRQRVGIGVSSPTATLDVAGDSTFRNRLRIGTTSGSLFGQINIGDSGDGSVFAISAESDQSAFPTIYADNAANGPVLWALSAGDVEPGSGGTIVVGDPAGQNVAMDNNEIMSRNNGSTSTLYLNADGGNINMGPYNIHPPYAYGQIAANGTLISGSSNVTGISLLSYGFRISIDGGVSPSDIIVATDANVTQVPYIMSAGLTNGKFEISCFSNVDGWGPHAVSFVIFRP